jgi:histone chaperone ASF1
MAVNVLAVQPLSNPASFTAPLSFEISYEALTNLEQDLEWKLTYVGSADSDQHDQVLENVQVGPVVPGQYRFVLEADAPNPARIPADDLVGVTVILLTCSYRGQEFIRVGYFVNNEYEDPALRETPPEPPQPAQLTRTILAEEPRVTRYTNRWDEPEQPEFPADGIAPMDEEPGGMAAEFQPEAAAGMA